MAWTLFVAYTVVCLVSVYLAGLSAKSVVVAAVEIGYMLVITFGITARRLAPLTRKHARIGDVLAVGVVGMFIVAMILVIPSLYTSDHAILGIVVLVIISVLLLAQLAIFFTRSTAESLGRDRE
ncbi:hypothetical protein [Mycobacteroides saopaulense]|uniref:hypothetical protein n=1 Tax=Mycobacteroides saopaulense TaxID=1578165 RepID=UPI0012FFD0DB|nr:hypothetical protein [Mycobacteroides saopaulense]